MNIFFTIWMFTPAPPPPPESRRYKIYVKNLQIFEYICGAIWFMQSLSSEIEQLLITLALLFSNAR